MAKKIQNQEDSLFDEPVYPLRTRSGKLVDEAAVQRLADEAFESCEANEGPEELLARWRRVEADLPDADPKAEPNPER